MVTSEQSPHLLLPLTSFGPQGDKIPAQIQPSISSDECAIYSAACDSSRHNKIHSWIASASDHRAPETDSIDTESLYGTDGQEKNPCDEARDYWENRKGRRVRLHGIARRTLFGPMHDEHPFCQDLTERRRTTIRFLGQQSEMTMGHNRVLDKRHATGRHLETQQTSQQHTSALSQSFDSKRSCHVGSTSESCCLE